MFTFRPINIQVDKETIVTFRRDSFLVSFGHLDGFGSSEAYLNLVTERSSLFPDGFVIVEESGGAVGQIESRIIEYGKKKIGYVHLFYLIERYRDKGRGKELVQYAEMFFQRHHVDEYHLRVSVTNERAISFYKRMGLEIVKSELGNTVYRMKKYI
jgi:ribosomal protein S18 acetylase RimI-like enzyme